MAATKKDTNYVNELVQALHSTAVVYRKDALAKFGKKWQIPVRTFDRYWKKALQQHQAELLEIKKKEQEALEAGRVKVVEEGVLNKLEAQKIATDIAKGKAWKVGGDIIAPTAGDRLKALDWLAKTEAWYTPEQVEITKKVFNVNLDLT